MVTRKHFGADRTIAAVETSGEVRNNLGCDPVHRLLHVLGRDRQPRRAGGEPRLGEPPEVVDHAGSGRRGATEWPSRSGTAPAMPGGVRNTAEASVRRSTLPVPRSLARRRPTPLISAAVTPVPYQPSPKRSARIRAASLWPPTHTGGPPGVTGGTPRRAARSVVKGPSKSVGRCAHRALAAARWSSVRAPRSRAGTPTASYSSRAAREGRRPGRNRCPEGGCPRPRGRSPGLRRDWQHGALRFRRRSASVAGGTRQGSTWTQRTFRSGSAVAGRSRLDG